MGSSARPAATCRAVVAPDATRVHASRAIDASRGRNSPANSGEGLQDRGHGEQARPQRAARPQQAGRRIERPDAPGMAAYEGEHGIVVGGVARRPDAPDRLPIACDQGGRCRPADEIAREDAGLPRRVVLHGGRKARTAGCRQRAGDRAGRLGCREGFETGLGFARPHARGRTRHHLLEEPARLDGIGQAQRLAFAVAQLDPRVVLTMGGTVGLHDPRGGRRVAGTKEAEPPEVERPATQVAPATPVAPRPTGTAALPLPAGSDDREPRPRQTRSRRPGRRERAPRGSERGSARSLFERVAPSRTCRPSSPAP